MVSGGGGKGGGRGWAEGGVWVWCWLESNFCARVVSPTTAEAVGPPSRVGRRG